jgi:hypothetical protein
VTVWGAGILDKKHFYRVGSHTGAFDDLPADADQLDALINGARKHIEPWLSAVFQAEHLNLLLGSGFTSAVGYIAGVGATGMAKVAFGTTYDTAIDAHAQATATAMKRGAANIEDPFRSALALLDGLALSTKLPRRSSRTASMLRCLVSSRHY